MKQRDGRLLTAAVLFLVSAVMAWIAVNRMIEYFFVYGGKGWVEYAKKYSIDCQFDCYPDGHYGLYAIVLFLAALALLLFAWWKPKA